MEKAPQYILYRGLIYKKTEGISSISGALVEVTDKTEIQVPSVWCTRCDEKDKKIVELEKKLVVATEALENASYYKKDVLSDNAMAMIDKALTKTNKKGV